MTTVDVKISSHGTLNLGSHQVAIWWLGQAGFLIRWPTGALVVDPYLSNSLAKKYRGATFDHVRMMPVPVEPSRLTGVDWVFSSHRHTDHMDVETLPRLLAANPGCRFCCPRAAAGHARDVVGIPETDTQLLDAGDHVRLSDKAEVDVLASAHEELQRDDDGNLLYLGFVFSIDGTRIYHSGDCVPYHGLLETLRSFTIDIALLPVNGRDEFRTSNGILGNFTFDEAVELCRQAAIPRLVPHHFGMFDFNTVDPDELRRKAATAASGLEIALPEVDRGILV